MAAASSHQPEIKIPFLVEVCIERENELEE